MAIAPCPECGGAWDLDEYPDACPHCELSAEDLVAAADFLDRLEERGTPAAKCDLCGTLLTAVEVRHGERTGHCGVHGRVLAVDLHVH